MGSILLYTVLGTIISTVVFGFFLFGLAKAGIIRTIDHNHALEGLVFGALISAVDPGRRRL